MLYREINRGHITDFFGQLGHAFSNYDEWKTNEMHFQSKPYGLI
jgi:hypothetical protein